MLHVAVLSLAVGCAVAQSRICASVEECQKLDTLYHIPGPNPIVYPRRAFNTTSWAGLECEVAGGLVKDGDEYFLIYHCQGSAASEYAGKYQVGMSSASTPLGPWSAVDKDTPLLELGAKGSWDDTGVASFNMIPMPTKEHPRRWVGFYEGVGSGNYSSYGWQMGITESLNGPRGPWVKHASNPTLSSQKVCKNTAQGGLRMRSFDGTTCNGMYVAAIHVGEHTGGKVRIYMEAPINQNDEGPMALWDADDIAGPYAFRQYVLDGGVQAGPRNWDQGRYSESRIDYDSHAKLWHLWATGSPDGNPTPSKYHENIGWAVSADGLNFTQFHGNPVASYSSSTPHTLAMSEGHSYIDESREMVYVYHTIRWDNFAERNWVDQNKGYYFIQPFGYSSEGGSPRNAEDLGVEIFAFGPEFVIDVGKSRVVETSSSQGVQVHTDGGYPLITRNWRAGEGLTLNAGEGSKCAYDWGTESFCIPFRAVIDATSPTVPSVVPRISFRVTGEMRSGSQTAAVVVHVHEYDYDNGVGKIVWSSPGLLLESVNGTNVHEVVTDKVMLNDLSSSKWMLATIELSTMSAALEKVEMFLGYDSRRSHELAAATLV